MVAGEKKEKGSMYCVRCRAACPKPGDVEIFKNKRGVAMRRGKCTNDKDGTSCGSKINSFMPKEKEG
jgi:hypothetical protein